MGEVHGHERQQRVQLCAWRLSTHKVGEESRIWGGALIVLGGLQLSTVSDAGHKSKGVKRNKIRLLKLAQE